MLDNLFGDWRPYRRWVRRGVWTHYRYRLSLPGLCGEVWLHNAPAPVISDLLTVLAVERW